MAEKSEEAKARAEARFKKEDERSREAASARAETAAAARAVDEKTARLKGLRLAKEADERRAGVPNPPPTKRPRK